MINFVIICQCFNIKIKDFKKITDPLPGKGSRNGMTASVPVTIG